LYGIFSLAREENPLQAEKNIMIFRKSKSADTNCWLRKRGIGRMLLFLTFSLLFVLGCAGGSLFRPKPVIGKDRLVIRIVNNADSVIYYTRNIWFDGDNYRFRDVYGRDMAVPKTDKVVVDLISPYDYYKTPR